MTTRNYSNFTRRLVALVLTCGGGAAHAIALEDALERIFRTNVLLTVAGLKPISEESRASQDESVAVIGDALERGVIFNPEIDFSLGVYEGYETNGYELDADRRVTRVTKSRVSANRYLRLIHRSALRRRLGHPAVKDLLRDSGFDPADPTLPQSIWRQRPRSHVLAGIGYGFPVRDVRAFGVEQRGSVGGDWETWRPAVGDIVPDQPPRPTYLRGDRRATHVPSVDKYWDAFHSITYGDQSRSAWARLRRRFHRVERLRQLAMMRGVSNIDLFNHWTDVACETSLGDNL